MMLALALSVFTIGSYLVWPSRWNIPAHFQLAFVIPAYVIPVLMTNALSQYPRDLLALFVPLLEVGAGFYIVGMVCGSALPRMKLTRWPFTFTSLSEPELIAFASRQAIWLGLFSILGMVVSFRVMGFVPMFAADPMVAKYLRGSYQDSYRNVAVLLRSSEQIIFLTVPIMAVLYYVTRRKLFALIGVLQLALQALTLSRGLFGAPLVTGLGLIAVSRGYKAFIMYLTLLVFAVVAASASTYYAARLLLPEFAQIEQGTVWENIASGAPDIPQTLDFMAAFERRPQWTYGRTFVGGLIPFHYRWNPDIWSLAVEASDEDLDINTVISGGLRLPPPVMGYTAFGWPGAIIVCLLSGLATGYGAVFARRYVGPGSLVSSVIALSLYNTAVLQFVEFYSISIYTVFTIFVAFMFAYRVEVRSSARTSGD
ncbi:MAG: hypothetical protein ACLQBA_27120 [Candidatus Binataceae bacterium]